MSAKRIKVEGAHGERRRMVSSNIRALSFSNARSSPPPRDISVMDTRTSTAQAPPSQQWTQDDVRRVTSSMQLHWNRQYKNTAAKKNGNNTTQLCLPLEEFYALYYDKVAARRADGTRTANTDDSSSAIHDNNNNELSDLTEPERFLYHLVCTAMPAVYTIRLLVDNNASLQGNEDDGKHPVNHQGWCILQHQPQTTTSSTETSSSRRNEVLQAIRSHRAAAPSRSRQQQQPHHQAPSSYYAALRKDEEDDDQKGPLIRSDMTVEERVRARAASKRKYEEEVAASNASTAKAGHTSDNAWLVRLADALWQHAVEILARQGRFQSPKSRKNNKTAACCIMTLKDVVAFLSRAVGGTASSHFSTSNTEKSSSRRQIVLAIQQMSQLAPDWICLTDHGDSSSSNNRKLSKNATVWIRPANYQPARAKLTGQPETAAKTVPSLKRPLPSQATSHHEVTTTTHSFVWQKTAASYPDSNTTPTKGITSPQLKNVVTAETTFELTPRKKSRAADHDRSTTTDHHKQRTTTSPHSAAASPSSSVKKHKKGLRINPLLILTPADHAGGEVIQPTIFESPRGLKNLFLQMRSGKRI